MEITTTTYSPGGTGSATTYDANDKPAKPVHVNYDATRVYAEQEPPRSDLFAPSRFRWVPQSW